MGLQRGYDAFVFAGDAVYEVTADTLLSSKANVPREGKALVFADSLDFVSPR